MDRRKFIFDTAIGAAGALAAGRRAFAGRGKDKPNVLLIMADQMRRPRWFPDDAKLPNLDRLKEEGMNFKNHYVSAVPCSPSRACLFTGTHMDQNNVRINVREGYGQPLDPSIPTLGHVFKERGYKTPYFGKWHLSLPDKKDKDGLDKYGFSYVPTNRKDSNFFSPTPGLETDPGVANGAAKWLSDRPEKGKPFFLTVSLINPHDVCMFPKMELPPILVPQVIHDLPGNFNDSLAGKPRCQKEYQEVFQKVAGRIKDDDKKTWLQLLNFYYYLNRKTDALVGRVLDALEKSGERKNTIVIFTSDHGEMGGSHRLRSKGPFVYQENTNTPLLVSWPGVIEKGTKTKSMASNVDIFPTLCEIIGAPAASYLPGRSLWPVLDNPEHEASPYAMFSYEGSRAMQRKSDSEDDPGLHNPHFIRAVRRADAVYARYFDHNNSPEEYEMYDTTKDELEMKNVAGEAGYAALRTDLAARLREAEVRAAVPVPRR